MNSKNAALVLRIDSLLMFASGLSFFFLFRPIVTSFLPDVTPSLYPRMFGAARIGLAMILWAAARDPEGLRDIIPGGIVARALDLAVLWPMILIARLNLPTPFGLSAVLVWALGTIATFIILGIEGLFWVNPQPKKQ